MTTTTLCYRCGSPADLEIEDGSAVCDACEETYQQFLREAYPHGQCWQCGVAYRLVTCEQGQQHTVANHIEGGCGQWSDPEPVEPEDVARGYCSYGCRPDNLPDDVLLDDLAELPF